MTAGGHQDNPMVSLPASAQWALLPWNWEPTICWCIFSFCIFLNSEVDDDEYEEFQAFPKLQNIIKNYLPTNHIFKFSYSAGFPQIYFLEMKTKITDN